MPLKILRRTSGFLCPLVSAPSNGQLLELTSCHLDHVAKKIAKSCNVQRTKIIDLKKFPISMWP